MSEQRLRRLKLVEAATLAVLFLLLALWGVNSEHPLFLLIHANPAMLDQWYPNFGWLMPHWLHIVLPVGIGSWTLALTIREKIPFRWILVMVGMILQLAIIHFSSLQVALLAFFIWVFVGYSRAFLARIIYRIVELLSRVNVWLGPIGSWFRSESNLPQARRVFFFVVAIGVVLRVCSVFLVDGTFDSDSSSRLMISRTLVKYYWPDHNILWSINPDADWLPLHFYINAALMAVGGKVVHIRLLHAIIGILCAPLVYRISKQLGSREAAMGATSAYLFYPASMIVCTQTLSEPLFLFTVLLSLYHFQLFCLNRAYSHLIISTVGLSLGALLRFEGWALLPVFPILYILFVRPYRLKEALTLLIPFSVPILIAILLVAQGFHPLRGINYSDYEVAKGFANSDQPIINLFMDGYIEGWIPFSLLSLIILTVVKWGDKKVMVFICFLVLFIAPFIYKNLMLTITPHSRYLTYYMTLFLIPLSLVLWKVVNIMFGRNPFSFLTYLSCIVLIAVSGAWAGSMRLPTAPRGFYESIAFVDRLNKGQYVVSEQSRSLEYLWLVELDMSMDLDFVSDSLSRMVDVESIRRGNDNNPIKCVYLEERVFVEFKVEELNHTLSEHSNLYLVLFEGSRLDKHFHFRELTECYKDQNFDREFEEGGFRIYHKQL
jgi:hypothetical protein